MDIVTLKQKLSSLHEKEAAVVYLGGAGFLLAGGGKVILCDPYLSYSVDKSMGPGDPRWMRLYPPPFTPEDLAFADLVCVSHDHLDHADPETLAPLCEAREGVTVVCSRAIEDKVRSYGASKIASLREGERIVRGDVSVTLIPAAHEQIHLDARGDPAECGFIVDFGYVKIYHSGDSLVYEGLSDRVAGADAILLPVNGNGFYRRADNIVGNMDSYDAARLASEAGARLLIPMHHDLYPGNSVPPEAVSAIIRAAAPELDFRLPIPGEGWRITESSVDAL